MTENQPSSSSKTDLDLSLKRTSVRLWILEGCDNNEPLLLKQDGCLDCFNLEFDRVIGDIPFTDDELARVYMAGLKDEIAALLRPFRPTSLLEAKYLADEAATKVDAEKQGPRPQESDGSSLSTQEVQEKALEDQEACGSSQVESFDKQEDRRATRIRKGGDCKETSLLKQHGSITEFKKDDGMFMTKGSSCSMGHFLLCIYTVVGIAVGFAIATSLPFGTVLWMVMLLSLLGIAFLYALARAILYIRTAVAAEGQRAAEVAAEQPPLDMEQPPPLEEEQPPLDMEQPPLDMEEEQPPLDTEQPPPTEEEQPPLDTEQPPPTEEGQPLTPMVNQLREGDEEA